jgi:hypothetical protein
MARRARIHSRDLQPRIATPKGLFSAPRVQRFDWPMDLPTTPIDELGRKLHVGTSTETPQVTVTVEAFDVTHAYEAYLTGYTPGTFPVSGASVADLKNADVIGAIRDQSTQLVVNTLYVKRATVTGIDYSFGVRDNSTATYTFSSNSKKELRQPVTYQIFTGVASGLGGTLSGTPSYLTRTSGYILDAYRTGADGSTSYLDEGTDFTVTGTAISFIGTNIGSNDTVWVTFSSPASQSFEPYDNHSPAAVQGKYVPVAISVNNIPRVQSATIRVAFATEEILEMGALGKPVGYEVGVPDVTGEITVLKTDNDLLNILEGTALTTVENDLEFAKTTLSMKIEMKNPANPGQVLKTYYIPSFTVTNESDTNQVNQSVNETFSWQSTTGELIILSGSGVY